MTSIQAVALIPYLYRYASPGPKLQAACTRILTIGGAGVGVRVGVRVMVEVKVKVGVMVTVGVMVKVVVSVEVGVTVKVEVNEGVRLGGRVATTGGTSSVGINVGSAGAQETPVNNSRDVMASSAWEPLGRWCLIIDDPLR
jgi:hypothetical protein